MKIKIASSELKGTAVAPPSKSYTIRGLMCAALAEGESIIEGALESADTRSAVRCYRQLGAQIECGELWRVRGVGGAVCPGLGGSAG